MTRGKSAKSQAAATKKRRGRIISSLFANAENNVDKVQSQLQNQKRSKTAERLLAIEQSMLQSSDSDNTEVQVRRNPTKRTKKAPKPRKDRQSESEKLLALSDCYQLTPSAQQTFELIEHYSKHHTLTCEPAVLRELLRMSHKFMTPGAPKSKIRGILGYFTRNPVMTTWMKTNQILKVTASIEKKNTFKTDVEIPFDRVVDQTTILRLNGNPHNQQKIQLMDAKVARLKTQPPKTKKAKPATTGEAIEGTYEGMPGLGSLDNLFID